MSVHVCNPQNTHLMAQPGMPDAPTVFWHLVVLEASGNTLDWITETSAPEATRNATLTPCKLRINPGGVLESTVNCTHCWYATTGLSVL